MKKINLVYGIKIFIKILASWIAIKIASLALLYLFFRYNINVSMIDEKLREITILILAVISIVIYEFVKKKIWK